MENATPVATPGKAEALYCVNHLMSVTTAEQPKALSFVKDAISIATEFDKIDLLQDDISGCAKLMNLVERLFETQNQFRNQGNGVPHHVDIAYHYTRTNQLYSIATHGILSREEREEKNIDVKSNGSNYGDGVYCSSEPYHRRGHVILLARLKGVECDLPHATYKRADYHTVTIPRKDICVLQSGHQCVPLFAFSSTLLEKDKVISDRCEIEFHHQLAMFHETLQRCLDKWFNDGVSRMESFDPTTFPGTSLTLLDDMTKWVGVGVGRNTNTEPPPIDMQKNKIIENCSYIADLKLLIYYMRYRASTNTYNPQLLVTAQKRLKTIRYHHSVRKKVDALRAKIAVENNLELKKTAEKSSWEKYVEKSSWYQSSLIKEAKACSGIKDLQIVKVTGLKQQADVLLNKGEFLAPRSLYREAIQYIIESAHANELGFLLPGLHSNCSVTYYRSKEYSKSLEECNKSLQLNPKLEITYIRKIIVLSAMGESTQKILQCLEAGLAMSPNSNILLKEFKLTLQSIRSRASTALKHGDLFEAHKLCDEGIGWFLSSRHTSEGYVRSCLAILYGIRSIIRHREGKLVKSLRDRDHFNELANEKDRLQYSSLVEKVSRQQLTKKAKESLDEWDLVPEAESLSL